MKSVSVGVGFAVACPPRDGSICTAVLSSREVAFQAPSSVQVQVCPHLTEGAELPSNGWGRPSGAQDPALRRHSDAALDLLGYDLEPSALTRLRPGAIPGVQRGYTPRGRNTCCTLPVARLGPPLSRSGSVTARQLTV